MWNVGTHIITIIYYIIIIIFQILMPCMICLLFLNYEPLLIYPLNIAGGAGVSVAYLVPW